MNDGFDPNWLPALAISAAMASLLLKYDLERPWHDAATAVKQWFAARGAAPSSEDRQPKTTSTEPVAHRNGTSPSGSMWESRAQRAEEVLTSAGLDGLDAPLADIWLCGDAGVRGFLRTVPGYPEEPAKVARFFGYLLLSREKKLPRAEVSPAEMTNVFWRNKTTRLDLALRMAGLKGVDSPSAEILACADRAVRDLLIQFPGSPLTIEQADRSLASLRMAKRELQALGEL